LPSSRHCSGRWLCDSDFGSDFGHNYGSASLGTLSVGGHFGPPHADGS